MNLQPLWDRIQYTEEKLDFLMSRKNFAGPIFRVEIGKILTRTKQVASEFLKLTTGIDNSTRRNKREAPLKLFGEISKVLIGTLTSRDKAELELTIQHVANNTNNVAKLLAAQTEVIQNEITNFKKDNEQTRKELDDLTAKMNSAESEILSLQVLEKFIEQITYLERQIDLLEESCLLATSNFINPLLLTNEQLENSIQIIKTANINAEIPLAEKPS